MGVTVSSTGDVDDVCVMLFDKTVQMNVYEILTWRSSPMTRSYLPSGRMPAKTAKSAGSMLSESFPADRRRHSTRRRERRLLP
jgi:hypothetical protein